jgi:hypothetical protein
MLKRSIIVLIGLCILIVVAATILPGCESSAAAVPSPQITVMPQPTFSAPATTTAAPATQKPSEPSTSVPPATPMLSSVKTEVIYFHLTARCVTCLCFEKNIKFLIDTYYQEAINNGKMTFKILNAQDKQNADIVKQYKAVGSQLFVNTVVNGEDHIKDIQEIWYWNCTRDSAGFNKKVKVVIDQSLRGEF